LRKAEKSGRYATPRTNLSLGATRARPEARTGGSTGAKDHPEEEDPCRGDDDDTPVVLRTICRSATQQSASAKPGLIRARPHKWPITGLQAPPKQPPLTNIRASIWRSTRRSGTGHLR